MSKYIIEEVNISDIKKGDLILSYNHDLNENEPMEVLDVIYSNIEEHYLFRTNETSVIVSKDTRLYIKVKNNEDYITSKELVSLLDNKEKCYLFNKDEKWVEIVDYKVDKCISKDNEFIDFTIKNNSNFFVKSEGDENFVLSHNSGAITVAVDIWYKDLLDFIQLKTEVGDLRFKAFNLFPQVVVNDIFMKRLKEDKEWYLLDHTEVLSKLKLDILVPKVLENNFNLIEEAVKSKKLKNIHIVKAKDVWKEMLKVYVETGDLYIVHKDNMNKMNPVYKNDMYIQSANLCVESYSPILHSKNYKTEVVDNKVMETFDMGFSHTCNLVSLNLTKILNDEKLLEKACRYSVRMLDKAIDVTTTPIPESNKHNQMFRTIGVCSMGLADWMAYNKLSYHKEEDWVKVEELYEKIAYYTLDESCNIAQEKGSFLEFENSYFKDGIILGRTLEENKSISKTNLNWDAIHEKVKLGVRNMFITSIAPNSSTSVLLNSSASYLPVFNKFYFESMNKMNIPVAPKFIKNRFWFYNEGFTVPTEKIVKLTSKIQKWVDCGISMELIINPSLTNIKKISDSIIEGFNEGLKTVYYSRTIEIDENGNKSENGKEIGCVSCAN